MTDSQARKLKRGSYVWTWKSWAKSPVRVKVTEVRVFSINPFKKLCDVTAVCDDAHAYPKTYVPAKIHMTELDCARDQLGKVYKQFELASNHVADLRELVEKIASKQPVRGKDVICK